MNEEIIAVYALVFAILAHGMVWFFKSPKEVDGELALEIKELRQQTRLNGDLISRHDERIKALIESLDRLTARLDGIDPKRRTPRRGL